jgi:hypothetical protein
MYRVFLVQALELSVWECGAEVAGVTRRDSFSKKKTKRFSYMYSAPLDTKVATPCGDLV